MSKPHRKSSAKPTTGAPARTAPKSGTKSAAKVRETGSAGEIRIIAGLYRGRRLRFPAAEGLRPSGDRQRETLFSWLQAWLPGARVLDLFAGSGALGFEAASRGAAAVLMNEKNPSVVAALRANRELLRSEAVRIESSDALQLLQTVTGPFNIIFLDPPFRADWLTKVLPMIAQRHLLADDGVIYLESEAEAGAPELPAGWYWHREKASGQVRYALARIDQNSIQDEPARARNDQKK